MKVSLLISLLLGAVLFDMNDIATINALKDEAQRAYTSGNYKVAFYKYKMLVDSFQVNEDELLLNYANSGYYLTGLNGKIDETVTGDENENFAEVAMSNYSQLSDSPDREIRSSAYNQLGVINYHMSNAVQDGKKYLNQSLAYFKQSLISNAANDNARYNYELVKKKLKEQENQQQDQQDKQNEEQKDEEKQENQEQQNQDQQNEENKENQENQEQNEEQQDQENQEEQQQNQPQNEEGEKDDNQDQEQEPQEGDQEEQQEQQPQQSPSEKLQDMKISEEMAQMILEALRNNEVQYIQQQKRKATKKADSNKPDW